MKFSYLLPFLFVAIIGCKKESEISPEELEQQNLAALEAKIINDWKVIKMLVVKPASQYGALATVYCVDKYTFSFKTDSLYEFTTPPDCGISTMKGEWFLPNQDSLYINYVPGSTGTFTEYQKIKLDGVTADTMKWHITTYGTSDSTTMEYTLIPNK